MTKKEVPEWFYISSIFGSFLFTAVIAVFTTLHFEDISNMNLFIIFMFIATVSFFLISAVYFISEKMKLHSIAPILFFIGLVSLMVYAFKALDASDLARYSIIYTIIVSAVSVYVLVIKRDGVKLQTKNQKIKKSVKEV
jgi:CHASE2 domain-containing sensor protein